MMERDRALLEGGFEGPSLVTQGTGAFLLGQGTNLGVLYDSFCQHNLREKADLGHPMTTPSPLKKAGYQIP